MTTLIWVPRLSQYVGTCNGQTILISDAAMRAALDHAAQAECGCSYADTSEDEKQQIGFDLFDPCLWEAYTADITPTA